MTLIGERQGEVDSRELKGGEEPAEAQANE